MPGERDKAYFWDMLDAALAVEEFVRGKTYEEYLSNRMMRGAVERHIEINRRGGATDFRGNPQDVSGNTLARACRPTQRIGA